MKIAGRYRLERYLARGGMAEVWAAQHEGLRSEVAIKFVDAALASDARTAPYALERFRFEAQISAKISAKTHHVVAVHDAGEQDGVPYLVMELINGRTLEEEVERSGPMTPERFADVLDQVADALEAAHALGIIHRDLKPSNLMLVSRPDGALLVKVADFGVAKSLRQDPSLDRPRETAQGELVGSPAFMSPEQIVGDPRVDARSDLWSLAVVTYEAVTGASCFDGANVPQLMMAIGKGVYRPASQVRPELPRGIDGFFARAFALRPENRFASARELAVAFRALLGRRRASSRALPLLVAGGLLVVALVVFVALQSSRVAETSAPAPPASLIIAPPNDVPPPVLEPPSPSVALTSTASATPRVLSTARTASTASAAPPAPAASPAVTIVPDVPPPPSAVPPRPKKRIDPSEIQ
jgi:serine/threonine protein kinase